MENYENYRKRMLKIRQARDFLYRFRVLIIGLTTMAIVGASGVVAITGTITDVDEAQYFYEYGDNIQLNSAAIFKDSYIEYSTKNGTTWSRQVPTLVGEYKYRPISKNSFNSSVEGKEYTFNIVPKKIDIEVFESNVLYGEKFRPKNPDLLYGDSLDYAEVQVEDELQLETTAYVKEETIRILDKTGNDVTYCYDFNIIPKKVRFNKRNLFISQYGGNKVYDGEVLLNEEYDVKGDLLPGDKILIPESLKITDVGSILNKRDIKIVNSKNIDVTHFYNIVNNASDLTISKRPLHITSNSLSKMYDGKDIELSYVIDDGSLLANHSLEIEYLNTKVFNIGTYENEFTFDILDEHKNSVLNNYDVKTEFGHFEITKIPLEIKIHSASKSYDGLPLSEGTYEIVGENTLLENHKIKIGELTTITNVGTTTNIVETTIVEKTPSATGEYIDVSNVYDFKVNPGLLEITKIDAKVTINPMSKQYDGTYLYGKSINVTGLLDGHYYNVEQCSSILAVGKINNNVVISIYDASGNNVSTNYNITYEGGENALEITKRPLKVKSFDDSKEFNNDPLYNTLTEVVGGTSLAEKDIISVFNYASLTNIGTIENVISINVYNSSHNDVTSSYEISYEFGTLEVKEKTISLFPYYSKTYDGRNLNGSFNLSLDYSSILPDGLYIESKTKCDGVDVGIYDMTLTEIKITNGYQDVTENFNIIVPSLKLEILPRDITVAPKNIIQEYKGTPIKASEYEIISGSLALGDTISCDFIGEATEPSLDKVKTSINNFVIKNKEDKNVNYNYNITLMNSFIELKFINLNFSSKGGYKVYDSKPLNYSKEVDLKGSLLNGHHAVYSFKEDAALINVSDKRHNMFNVTILDENDIDVTNKYYKVTTTFGYLYIEPMNLYVEPLYRERIYNGKPYSVKFDDYTLLKSQGGLVSYSGTIYDDYSLYAKRNDLTNYSDAGSYFYDMSAKLVDKDGNIIQDESNFNQKSNYRIYVSPMNLVIQNREITITLASGNKYYGEEKFENKLWISNGKLLRNHHLGPYELLTFDEIGRNQLNTISSDQITILDENGVDVTSNYNIKIIPGIVNILKPGEIIDPPPDVNPDGDDESTTDPVPPIDTGEETNPDSNVPQN